MLTKIPFYHSITRKMVVAVGGLFSHLSIRNKDIDGVTQKIVTVPLAYANKEKFIVRLQQDPSLNEDTQTTLPRMAFEIVGSEYDAARQLNKMNSNVVIKDGFTTRQFAPVPYILSFNLYSFTRTQEDNLQILEQIVPFFTPDMNLAIKVLQNPDQVQNCPLILNSVNTDDAYDGGFEERRYIITTYSFQLKMYYYGPFFGLSDTENHFESGETKSVIKRVIVNVNTNKYTAEIDPFEANETDPHSIIEGWTERTYDNNDFDTEITL